MRELDIRPIIELTQQAGQAIMPYFSGENIFAVLILKRKPRKMEAL